MTIAIIYWKSGLNCFLKLLFIKVSNTSLIKKRLFYCIDGKYKLSRIIWIYKLVQDYRVAINNFLLFFYANCSLHAAVFSFMVYLKSERAFVLL